MSLPHNTCNDTECHARHARQGNWVEAGHGWTWQDITACWTAYSLPASRQHGPNGKETNQYWCWLIIEAVNFPAPSSLFLTALPIRPLCLLCRHVSCACFLNSSMCSIWSSFRLSDMQRRSIPFALPLTQTDEPAASCSSIAPLSNSWNWLTDLKIALWLNIKES